MVRCYEVGPDRTATIVTVANLLQETAANHAQALWGRGSWTPSLMQEQKLAFALSKMSIRMGTAVQWCVGAQGEPGDTPASCFPVASSRAGHPTHAAVLLTRAPCLACGVCCRNDRVRVSTWFAEAGTLAARRDWVIADAATGQQLGAATSTWLAFNLETRRMARLPPTLRTYFDTASPSPPRHALGEHYSPEKLAELLPDAPCYVSSKTRVRRCDLDMNLHVNNASYLAWIMDDVPDAVFATAMLTGVDIEYRAECVFGDNLESRATLVNADGSCVLPGDADPLGGQPLGFRHSLVRASDGVEILRARTSWEPLAGGAGHNNGHNGGSR